MNERTSSELKSGVVDTRDAFADSPRLLSTLVTRSQLLRLAMKGLNASEAAKIVGCHPQTARTHYADPSFRDEVRKRVDGAFADVDEAYTERRKSLHELLEDQSVRSFTDLVGMLGDPNLHPSIRMRINQDFLNRVEESSQITRSSNALTAEALASAAKTAREMDNVVEFRKKAS